MESILCAGFLFLGSTLLLCFSHDLVFVLSAILAACTGFYLIYILLRPLFSEDKVDETDNPSEGAPHDKP